MMISSVIFIWRIFSIPLSSLMGLPPHENDDIFCHFYLAQSALFGSPVSVRRVLFLRLRSYSERGDAGWVRLALLNSAFLADVCPSLNG